MIAPLLALALAAADGFVERGTWDGVAVSTRAVPGSSFAELRFVARGRGSLAALCDRAFGSREARADEPHLLSRQVLSEGPDERVTYERIAPPLVSRRDYVVRRQKSWLSPRVCRVEFASLDGEPEQEGWVRLKRLAGSFLLEEEPGGTVKVEHRIHMDPGGLLTPVLVEATRQRMGLEWMQRFLRP